MRSWSSLERNNNTPSMVTSCWNSINHVEISADIPATLMHSYTGSVGGEGMAAVTTAFIYRFGIGCCHHDFLLVFLVIEYRIVTRNKSSE